MENDLVMESTTDTPEQMAEGLSLTLADDADVTASDVQPDSGAAVVEEPAAPGDPGDGGAADSTEVVTTAAQTRRAEAPREGRPQKKTVNGAAAAARREADARTKVLEVENNALKRRLEELAVERSGAPVAATQPARVTQPAAVEPESIPDTHPEVAAALRKVEALGKKPKQEDFPDFDEFETKRDEWLITRGRLESRVDSVREDVARRETSAQVEASRAAAVTADAYKTSVAAAKERYEDYDDVMDAATAQDLRVGNDVAQVIFESPIGADVIYYLAKHPAEIARLKTLSSHRAIAEVGMLEGRLRAAIKPPSHQPGKQQPAARITRAPDPQETVLGDLGGNPGTGKKIDDENLTLAEYNRLRDAQDVASGRRTH